MFNEGKENYRQKLCFHPQALLILGFWGAWEEIGRIFSVTAHRLMVVRYSEAPQQGHTSPVLGPSTDS